MTFDARSGVVEPEGDNTGRPRPGGHAGQEPVDAEREFWIAVRSGCIQLGHALDSAHGAALQIAAAIEQRYNLGKKGGR
jgi:hypothetical protein